MSGVTQLPYNSTWSALARVNFKIVLYVGLVKKLSDNFHIPTVRMGNKQFTDSIRWKDLARLKLMVMGGDPSISPNQLKHLPHSQLTCRNLSLVIQQVPSRWSPQDNYYSETFVPWRPLAWWKASRAGHAHIDRQRVSGGLEHIIIRLSVNNRQFTGSLISSIRLYAAFYF